MEFTRQDAMTFAIGLAAAIGVALGQALVTLTPEVLVDPDVWLRNLFVALAVAVGRYLITRLGQTAEKQGGDRRL
ncbi:MAG: hypothetical protein GEU28_11220 [Dehalococcoidia bacterium]|nr:hypothetical protein [Dehalococcoidia bacterium]